MSNPPKSAIDNTPTAGGTNPGRISRLTRADGGTAANTADKQYRRVRRECPTFEVGQGLLSVSNPHPPCALLLHSFFFSSVRQHLYDSQLPRDVLCS